MRDLKDIREDLNDIDARMKELFLQRMELANQVAEYKLETGGQVYDEKREREMLKRHLDEIPTDMQIYYEPFLKSVIRLSRKKQYGIFADARDICYEVGKRKEVKKVGFQGVEGSYSHAAARAMYPNCEYVSFASFEEVARQVRAGHVDAGVLPFENSTAGNVTQVLDSIVEGVYICKEHVEKIEHCLAAKKGASFKHVVSHSQALSQCENYIKEHGLQAQVASNTAIAAQRAAKEDTIAAICSREAAMINGLEIIEENINDFDVNSTRFVAIQEKLTASEQDDRVTITFRLPDEAGALAGVMYILESYRVNATEITSRPVKSEMWDYLFYLTLEGNIENKNIQALLYQLESELPALKVIGSFKGVSK